MIYNNTIIYNNLVKISRNNNLYDKFTSQDTFSHRLTILLIHFAFFIKCKKNKINKNILQKIHDDFFNSLEFDIRESGYGDVTVNKKMKDYLNIFYYILKKIHRWDYLIKFEKVYIFNDLLNTDKSTDYLVEYFDKFNRLIINNTLNYFTKGVIKLKF